MELCQCERKKPDADNAERRGYANAQYIEEYDSFHCLACGKWIEPKCSDTVCCFCSKRPDLPPKE